MSVVEGRDHSLQIAVQLDKEQEHTKTGMALAISDYSARSDRWADLLSSEDDGDEVVTEDLRVRFACSGRSCSSFGKSHGTDFKSS